MKDSRVSGDWGGWSRTDRIASSPDGVPFRLTIDGIVQGGFSSAAPNVDPRWLYSTPEGFINWSSSGSHHVLQVPRSLASASSLHSKVHTMQDSGKRIFLDLCSGATRPLSQAVLGMGCPVLSVDILLDASMDLFSSDFYEDLLHLCGSGIVGYAAASPSCSEYSALKLDGRPPFALRTPDNLEGRPDLQPHGCNVSRILRKCCTVACSV